MPTVTDAEQPAIALLAGTASVSRSVVAGSSVASYLQAAYNLRARELASMPLNPDYSDEGRSESWVSHRAGLLSEMETLLRLMSRPDAGVPWEFNQGVC